MDAKENPPGREKNMNDSKNPNVHRRALGLLMVLASVLTLIATWNLSETEGN
jgi:hypothetical protein